MVKKKGKSKRISLKDKYKIQRRVVESHRKSRKQAKRDAKSGIVRHNQKKKKDPGIPNSWPFKQDLLNEIGRARERAETRRAEEKERRTERLRALNEDKEREGEGGTSTTATTYEELVARASKSGAEFDSSNGGSDGAAGAGAGAGSASSPLGQQSRRAYLRELRKVVSASDVLLQVLDARDPLGTRINSAVENAILSHADKKMVLVLNKIDLVPKDAVSGWLTYLRRSHPTVAIKAGTNQSRSGNVGQTKGGESALSSSSGVGVDGLLHLLKNYARHTGTGSSTGGGGKKKSKKASSSKACITVGIIGYPNVGKSSILNTLKRSRAVGVSPRPGFTTAMQEVVLDRNVRLVDSPGVVFDDVASSGDDGGGGHALLRNCVDADSVNDPIPAVSGLLSRCSPESLMMVYSIPAFPTGDVTTFLAMVAKRSGRVLKGGVPDKVSAARSVLRDWNSGKIPYYTEHPEVMVTEEGDGNNGAGADSAPLVVDSFGAEFDVAKMREADEEVMRDLPEDGMDFVRIEPVVMAAPTPGEGQGAKSGAVKDAVRYLTRGGSGGDDSSEEDDDDEMEEDDVGATAANAAAAEAEDYDFDDL